jgi:hypothetical protein
VDTKKVEQIFFPLLFCCCCWIRDPGWIKLRIRDKHPGSATLTNLKTKKHYRGGGGGPYHGHKRKQDVVLSLPLPQEVEVCGEGRVRVHPLYLHVPLVQAVVHQLHLHTYMLTCHLSLFTINVLVVYLARDVMIWCEKHPFRGICPKYFWGPTPSNGPSNGFAPHQNR